MRFSRSDRRACDAANGGGGRVGASLREAQQRQARLGLQAQLARASIRLLGRRELPFQTMDLCLLVERGGGSPPVDALRTRAGAPRFLDRLRPGAVQLHDLRAMHLADAGEGDHIGLALAPLRQGGRPLAGAVERIDLLTGLDHAAVHQARHEGRQLSGGDRDHGLVQEREPGFDLPLLQSNPALLVAGAGDEVRVAAALADRGGVGRSGVRGLEVTRIEALLDDRQQQIAPLGALARVALQQPLGTGKPAGRAAHLAAHEQAKAEPERAADGASALAGVAYERCRRVQAS